MTIKEMESRTEMTRANIRFYEAEGLLSPKRNENGYRDYSEEDFETLMKIKLLRSLRISLEEIKTVHSKEMNLDTLLKKHISHLEFEKNQIIQSQNVCEQMIMDGVRYDNLNAVYYLNKLRNEPEKIQYKYDVWEDVIPKVYAPWRRYFARTMDFAIYSTIVETILVLAFRINLEQLGTIRTFISTIFGIILMVAIEPILISKFGTTIGKAVLGLYITDLEGGKLSYNKSVWRTVGVLLYGLGFYLPFYNYYRMWKSYSALNESKELEWEDESSIELKDEKFWRYMVYVAARFAIIGILSFAIIISQLPVNRGELTTAEFCENYNKYAGYYDTRGRLNPDGTREISHNPYSTIIEITQSSPNFIIEEKDGMVESVRMSCHFTNNQKFMIRTYNDEMTLAILSFVKAQDEYQIFANEFDEMMLQIQDKLFEDFEYELYGIRITCDYEYEGYEYAGDLLFSTENVENMFSFDFAMEKIKG